MVESIRQRMAAMSHSSDSIQVKKILDNMRTELVALGTTVADYKAIYDAHTHECPGSSYTASRCSTPDTGAAENSLAASAASAFTDTSGDSVPSE